jgi:hypothetical protein
MMNENIKAYLAGLIDSNRFFNITKKKYNSRSKFFKYSTQGILRNQDRPGNKNKNLPKY